MKKRFGAFLLAGVMACSMTAGVAFATGCGSKVAPAFEMPEGGFDVDKEVTIKFYHTMGQTLRDELDAALADFKVMYPNITVEHEQVGGYDDVRTQISTQLAANNQPDIAYCYPDHVALYNRGKAVMYLNDFLPGGTYADMEITRKDGVTEKLGLTEEQKNQYIESYYNEGFAFEEGEKMYTLPFSKSTEVLYYNKTYFDANNIAVPTTWDEMEQVCAKLKQLDPECIPLGYDSEANWFITMCEQYGSEYTSATGNHFRFDNQTNRDFVEKFYNWYKKGYFTTQEIFGAYTSTLFVSQDARKSYMSIGSSAGANHQRPEKVDGAYPFQVGIASIPQVNTEKPKVISQGPSVCIFKQEDPQRMIASWLLVKYLTTNIDFQASFSAASGYVPVLKMDVMETNTEFKASLDAADNGDHLTALSTKVCLEQEKAYYTSPAFIGSSKARDEVGSLLQAVFTGSKTLDQAFKDAMEECEYFSD